MRNLRLFYFYISLFVLPNFSNIFSADYSILLDEECGLSRPDSIRLNVVRNEKAERLKKLYPKLSRFFLQFNDEKVLFIEELYEENISNLYDAACKYLSQKDNDSFYRNGIINELTILAIEKMNYELLEKVISFKNSYCSSKVIFTPDDLKLANLMLRHKISFVNSSGFIEFNKIVQYRQCMDKIRQENDLVLLNTAMSLKELVKKKEIQEQEAPINMCCVIL